MTASDNISTGPRSNAAPNLDRDEVAHFNQLAEAWWDRDGAFKPLHALSPARMLFVRDAVNATFGCDETRLRPLKGRSVLDVGCGGGLATEPLARLGGTVLGIDPGTDNIGIARAHAGQSRLAITYRAMTAEALVAEGATFDLVVCLEVLEHVPDPRAFVATLGQLVKPGGLLVLSTLNRTQKSYALAIIGAEYVLRWLAPGTHDWDKFITPDELREHLTAAGFEVVADAGLTLNPLSGSWDLSGDLDVNYMMAAEPRAITADPSA